METKILKTEKAIRSLGETILKSNKQMEADVQSYLCSQIVHIEKHRNPTSLNEFIDSLGDRSTVRRSAMLKFVVHFGHVTWENGAFKVKKRERDISDIQQAHEAAANTLWTEFTPDTIPPAFILENRIKSIVNKAKDLLDNPREGVIDKINKDQLKALEQLLAS